MAKLPEDPSLNASEMVEESPADPTRALGESSERASRLMSRRGEAGEATAVEKVKAAQTVAKAAAGDPTAAAKIAANPEKQVGTALGVSEENQERVKEIRKISLALSKAVSAIFNPFFWIAVAIIGGLLVFVNNMKTLDDVIGRNPNACKFVNDCSVAKGRANAASALDTTGVIALARQIAWADGRKVGAGYGKEASRPEYRSAKEEAMKISPDPLKDLYSSCDRFVATVIKLTQDKDIPWGNTETQRQYLKGSSKWARRTSGPPQPGDILVTIGPGHIVLFLDNGDVAQASYLNYTARVSKETWVGNNGIYHPTFDSRQYEAYYFVGG